MRPITWILLALVIPIARAQDAAELVRKSIAQDQLSWARMKDYTWQARSLERRYNSHGQIESQKEEAWETLILEGQPYRRMLERDGKLLNDDERNAEQKKLDREVEKLTRESPQQKQHRLEDAEKQRKQEFAFVAEIPALFDLQLDGEGTVDGRPVWIVSGTPRAGAKPKSHDAAVLLKVRGRLWIDKASYQWVKIEAETTGVISWGVFLARLHPGAKLTFEQTRVSSDVWLPKRLFMSGSGRVALVKRLTEDQEIQWSNYRKFSVDSKLIGN